MRRRWGMMLRLVGVASLLFLSGAVSATSQEVRTQDTGATGKVVGRPVLGSPTGFARTSSETVLLEAGSVLLVGPVATAEVLAEVPNASALDRTAALVERRSTQSGEWLRLRWGGLLGWYNAEPADVASDGALAILAETARLERRSAILKLAHQAVVGGREQRWPVEIPVADGGVDRREIVVWSSIADRPTEKLRRLSACIGSLYAERFGPMTEPPPLDLEMVIFPDRASYERFVAASTVVVGSETSGFELDGLVLVAADLEMEVGFLGTVAHELTHALNRLSFPDRNLRPWVEEGMAEDIAHSVEAAYVQSRRPCRVPGGWSRTAVREAVVMDEARARKETRLKRSPRARTLLCYPNPEGVADLLSADRAGFGAAFDRRWKYVESLLLVRHLLQQAGPDFARRRGLLLDGEVVEPELTVIRALAKLPWRVSERELMDC